MLPFLARWNWFKDDFEQRTGGFHFKLRAGVFMSSMEDSDFFNAWLNIKYLIQCGDRYSRTWGTGNEHLRLNGVNVRMKLFV